MNTHLNSGLVSAFEGKKPTRKPLIQVTVPLSTTYIVETLAQAIEKDLMRISDWIGTEVSDTLSVENLTKYLVTLAWLRTSFCNYNTQDLKALKNYKVVRDRLAIPTLFYQVLISIGVIEDTDYEIEFIPSMEIDGKELLDPDSMLEISNELHSFRACGFKMVQGLPRDPSGDLEFMAMQCLEDEMITSYRDSHPVYAFLHSFIRNTEVISITDGLSRYFYGNVASYRASLFSVYNAVSGDKPKFKDSGSGESKFKGVDSSEDK